MIMSRWFSLLVLGALFVGSSLVEAKSDEWKGWRCDDMTPGLCDDLQVTKDTFSTRKDLKIHYWRYASPNSDKDKFPVVIVNGGPGMPHNYDLPLRQLACRGREVIFYDQGGTGESTLPPNTTVEGDFPFLLDVSYYAEEELPALIEAAKLKQHHIVSDSWGTMIVMQSVINHRNPNLVSLSLNGPIPKSSEYVARAWDPVEGSVGTLPSYIKERMLQIEASGDFESEEMMEIQMAVLANFYSRNGLIADCASKSFYNANEEVEVGLWGAVDFFNSTGTLQDYDVWPSINDGALNDIPILLTSGKYDVVRPVTVNAMYDSLPLSEKILFANSGHVSVFDATEELLNAVGGFLEGVERAESGKKTAFTPKRPLETNESPPATLRQCVVTTVIVIITFILGVAVGQCRGRRVSEKRSQYREIA